jgi:Transposase, Mutator family
MRLVPRNGIWRWSRDRARPGRTTPETPRRSRASAQSAARTAHPGSTRRPAAPTTFAGHNPPRRPHPDGASTALTPRCRAPRRSPVQTTPDDRAVTTRADRPATTSADHAAPGDTTWPQHIFPATAARCAGDTRFCNRLYDVQIRRVICSTNAIESLNARYRRAIKARGHFPSEHAALKCLYLVTRSLDPTGVGRARWTMRCTPALNAFAITFSDRFPAAETY